MFKRKLKARVFIKPEEGSFRLFELKPFKEEEEERLSRKVRAEKEFKPDFEGIREKEFVLGGFDFDYHGGYRRDEILKKTSDEVEGLINQAKARVAEIEKEAREKGHKEGFEKGHAEGLVEVRSLMKTLDYVIEGLFDVRKEFYEKSEKEMVDIIILTASEIIRREVKEDRDVIKDVIRKAVEGIHSLQEITISLNPRDIESARELTPELMEKMETIKNVRFEENPSISEGGCLVETNVGKLDATVENRLMAIYKNLRQRVHY